MLSIQKLRKVCVIAGIILLCGIASIASAQEIYFSPEIKKTEYKPGEKIKMSWESEGLDSDLKLSIYLNSTDGHLYPIKTGLNQKGKFTWKIPKATAPALYELSMSSEDKGPSVSSEDSAPFTVVNKKSKTESVRVFDVKADSKKIQVKMGRNNGSMMGLNIACDANLISMKVGGDNLPCNVWRYFEKKNDTLKISYTKRTTNDVEVYFTLDVYGSEIGSPVQRLFKDVTL
jgi:hypothetical protein